MTEKMKCTVRDGNHVEPCVTLAESSEGGNPQPRKRGIFPWVYYSPGVAEPVRTFFGCVSTTHPKGFAFNFCPFCGEKINAPFVPPDFPPQKDKEMA